jgi:hypothetical protein
MFICPLCMREFKEDEASEKLVSLEHVIPSALGGNVATLTCTACNNTHGSALDGQLFKTMKALDALQGHGPIRGVLQNKAGHVAVDMSLKSGRKDDPNIIRILPKASAPAGVNAIPDLLVDGATLNYTLNFGFVPLQYWRAVLRIGYLAAFHRFGYFYALSDGAAQVRRVLVAESPTSQVIMSAYPNVELPTPLISVVEMRQDDVCFIVVFRIRSAVTRHLAVLLPGIDGSTWEGLGEIGTELRKMTLTTSPRGSASKIKIRFSDEPITQIREIPQIPSVG